MRTKISPIKLSILWGLEVVMSGVLALWIMKLAGHTFPWQIIFILGFSWLLVQSILFAAGIPKHVFEKVVAIAACVAIVWQVAKWIMCGN